MKPNELLQTTWRERNREWIWRIYLPPQIVPTLNNPSATDVVSPGGCAKAWLGQSMGVDKVWFMMVHVVVQACACLLVPCQLAGSAWTTPTILSCLRHPAFYCAFLACLSLAWNVPLLHKKTGFFWVAPSTNHFTIGYFLDMTCLFREINGGFPSLLNFPIFSPDLCI